LPGASLSLEMASWLWAKLGRVSAPRERALFVCVVAFHLSPPRGER
jgi:hypothetical protein